MWNAKTKMEIKFLLNIPCSVWVCPFSSWYGHGFLFLLRALYAHSQPAHLNCAVILFSFMFQQSVVL